MMIFLFLIDISLPFIDKCISINVLTYLYRIATCDLWGTFSLMDMGTGMYMETAISIRSEMDAYRKALELTGTMYMVLRNFRFWIQ